MAFFDSISRHLSDVTGRPFVITQHQEVSGGCTHRAVILTEADGQRFFVKVNNVSNLPVFEAEADGLEALCKTGTVLIPRPLGVGSDDEKAYLVLEFLELVEASQETYRQLGQALAAMHRVTHQEFGWHRNNAIGTTPQINTWQENWPSFFSQQRLQHQLHLVRQRGSENTLRHAGERLMEKLPMLFSPYRPTPSLLHGDLWNGNIAATPDRRPVIYDPAVYFGDRETDIAMTELFGGFSADFYRAYNDAWPLDPGYRTRKTLYNLYHVLNHYHLFGGGYGAQANTMIKQLLSELA